MRAAGGPASASAHLLLAMICVSSALRVMPDFGLSQPGDWPRLRAQTLTSRGRPTTSLRSRVHRASPLMSGSQERVAATELLVGPDTASKENVEDALRLGRVRAALVAGISSLTLVYTLPRLPEFWRIADATSSVAAPLCTMAAMCALVVFAWSAFGPEMHPITAKARGLKPPQGYTFQVLGMSAVMLASAAIAFSWYPLPVALSPLEIMHCVLPFALWQADAALLRALNPHVEWTDDATSLPSNYEAEHASPLGALLACLGVIWFEVYIQQTLASPLTLAGWPLLGSASLIALSAGLIAPLGCVAVCMSLPPPQVNHAIANGLLNGIACMEFYWTVSLMFSLSNSVLPVGLYHHLMYSMPCFMKNYDDAVEIAPSPAAHALMLHGTLMLWHLALFSVIALAAPKAMELLPAVQTGLAWIPTTTSNTIGLLFLGLYTAVVVGIVTEALRPPEESGNS